jgi:hypothetical protein
MHRNAELLHRLFHGLNEHDHLAMAHCYREDAAFRDIAFDLHGRQQIHAMWHMICTTDIQATFRVVHADDIAGQVELCDDYTFGSTGRAVHNVIDSRFRFEAGLIADHHDSCDARLWGQMALGGIEGCLAGRIRLLRAVKARRMLEEFVNHHQQYRAHSSAG